MDYDKLGLKIGLEIHQQLETSKLFCKCTSKLVDEYDYEIIRKLRPTQSELGDVDRAAVEEAQKKLRFKYQVTENNCLVETDEEPPHEPNKNAIDVVLMFSKMVNAKSVDEIYFMRKVVIDGSNISGFQRTALLSVDGKIDQVNIQTICLEEDAARKIKAEKDFVVYRLDRLGIPLIEIATAPDIKTPGQAKEVAEKIGAMLRATKKVKRGIGTIRQDLNVSIKNGARVEIKGVQNLRSIPDVVEKEISRQIRLIEIKNKLEERNAKISYELFDITNIFENTKCKIIKAMIQKNGKVFSGKLSGFSGLLGGGENRLGKEFASKVKRIGLKGIFHSDELPNYGITENEVEEIRKNMKLDINDAFVIVSEKENIARNGLNIILERAERCIKGVPEEVRKALQDNTTEYMRAMPGAARMYPETDIPPVSIKKEEIDKIKIPELFDKKIKRFMETYKISFESAKQLVARGYDEMFESFVKKYESKIVARTFLNSIPEIEPELESKGMDASAIPEKTIEEVLGFYKEGRFAKEGISKVLLTAVTEPVSVEEAIEKAGLLTKTGLVISLGDIENEIDKILMEKKDFIKEKGKNSFAPLMGLVMKELRGKADGKIISAILKKKIGEMR
ncbi:MAG: Glu-tRNA(Gln) amidotransferase subunit GatE [Thermoplasmatales archaeon]|nr:Glu-tRNA(Gln) amidotransferase subunit GatE [Thermoplasmatales archaeon]